MIEYLERRLSPEKTIQNYLPKIIQTFIEYYGEENKDNIINKFQNIFLICTQTPSGLKNNLFHLKQTYGQELIKIFFQNINFDYNTENVQKFFGTEKLILENPTLTPIGKLFTIINNEQVPTHLKNSFLKDIKPLITLFYPQHENLETIIKTNNLEKLSKIYAPYQELLQSYNNFKSKLTPYYHYIAQCKKLKKQLKQKYTLELIEIFKDYFNEEEIQTFKEKGYLSGKLALYLGDSLDVPSKIEAFSTESQKLIENPNAEPWQVNSIIEDRITFFRNMGINLDNVYQNYQNNPECQAIMPNKELVKNIRDAKEELETKMYNEYFTSISKYQKTREKIDNLNLCVKDDGYNAGTFMYNATYITPNAKEENGIFKPFSLININFDIIDEFIDQRIIHEFNHAYELSLKKVDEKEINYTCGWENFFETLNPNSNLWPLYENKTKRTYESFNEIINEIIAQEITEKMHKNGVYIFYPQNQAKIKNGTSYESTRFLVQTFYDIFKEEIIKSRNGNIEYLFNACGQENFDSLNELFHEFIQNWPGSNATKLFHDIENNIDNEDTQKFKEIIRKRNKILVNMLKYKIEANHKKTK